MTASMSEVTRFGMQNLGENLSRFQQPWSWPIEELMAVGDEDFASADG